MSFRDIRRAITSTAVALGARAAPWLPLPAFSAAQGILSLLGKHAPILAPMVRNNMRAAGVFTPEVFHDYFRQVALHLANAARIFHYLPDRAAVQRLAREQIGLDDTISILAAARAEGRGVLLAPAHTVNFVLTLARLNLEIPICIFLRWSNDARKLRLKRDWCEACGLRVVMEPAGSLSATSRAAICVDELRAGAVLAITPDVAQKSTEGTAVKLLNRTAFLPSGAAAIAGLAESPIVPLFGRLEASRQVLYCNPAFPVEQASRDTGGRKASLQRAMQTWTTHFEAFIRQSPAAWFLWGDSRWTRVLRNDPKYTAPAEQPAPNADHANAS